MDTCSFDTHTSADRVDTIVEGLYRHFSALTRDTGDILNRNQTFLYLRHFLLEETLQEERCGTREDDFRRLVLVLHLDNYGANDIALAVVIGRDLVLLGQIEFVTLLIEEQHLFLPYLIEFAGNDLSHHIAVSEIEALFLQLKDFRSERLTEVEDHSASERRQLYFVRYLFANLRLIVELERIAECNLGVGISHIAVLHHQTVTINLQVTFVRVDDDHIVSRRTVHLEDYALERLLQHGDKRLFVNTFEIFEFRENVNQID